jgi:protein TonB
MAKPLRSEISNPPDRQFAHFGVLDVGGQNKGAFVGSIVFNVILALIALIIGASVKKMTDIHNKEITLVVPLKEKPPEPLKPKVIPPKLPPPPKIQPKIEPPKIKLPDVVPEPPKPIAVAVPKPVPVITPAPPKVQAAAAAPKIVSVNMPAQSAALKNNSSAPPAPVSLGRQDSPVPNNLRGPAVSQVRLNNGMSGMPPGAGVGRPSAVTLGGNGSPNGSLGGGAVAKVEGVKLGVIGGTGRPGGNGSGTQVAQVSLGGAPPPPPPATRVTSAPVRTGPQVLYKPKPVYTAEATREHIEGTVAVRIKVSASGAVTVEGIASGHLGHGLDESAMQCAQGIRFKPAVDASGNPVEWEGVVNITFQMA